jgi:hypothetical protein
MDKRSKWGKTVSAVSCRSNVSSFIQIADLKPQVFVTPGQQLANGRLPKNNSNILIAGQTWMQFSFNIPWSDGDNIMRFIAAARQRFTQNE